jgi:hypothetical protein
MLYFPCYFNVITTSIVDPSSNWDPSAMGCLLSVSMFAKKTALVLLLFKSATTKNRKKTN